MKVDFSPRLNQVVYRQNNFRPVYFAVQKDICVFTGSTEKMAAHAANELVELAHQINLLPKKRCPYSSSEIANSVKRCFNEIWSSDLTGKEAGHGQDKHCYKIVTDIEDYIIKIVKQEPRLTRKNISLPVEYIQGKNVEEANLHINQGIIKCGNITLDKFIPGKIVGLANIDQSTKLPQGILQNYYSPPVAALEQKYLDEFAQITKKLHKQKIRFDFENPNNFIIADEGKFNGIYYIDDLERWAVAPNIDDLLEPLMLLVGRGNSVLKSKNETVTAARKQIMRKVLEAGVKADISMKEFSDPAKSIKMAVNVADLKIQPVELTEKLETLQDLFKKNPELDVTKAIAELI